jgi:hypothetical protein
MPACTHEPEAGARRLMRADRIIHNKIRAANRECSDERSPSANNSDGEL